MAFQVASSRRTGRHLITVGAVLLLLGLFGLGAQPARSQTTSNNVGGGEAHGGVTFTNAGGLPQLFAPCKRVTFALNGDSEATFVINVKTQGGGASLDGFAGAVTLAGSGIGFCEGTSSGGGTLQLSVPHATAANGSTFACPDLDGGYTRVGPDVEAILGGTCAVNSNNVPVMVVFRGLFTPTGGSGLDQPGLSRPVTSADFDGTFVVMPA